jgi:hypothetical protein
MDLSKLKYVSTDTPTTDELELLNESRIRVGQVIQARWIILGILATYGILPGSSSSTIPSTSARFRPSSSSSRSWPGASWRFTTPSSCTATGDSPTSAP